MTFTDLGTNEIDQIAELVAQNLVSKGLIKDNRDKGMPATGNNVQAQHAQSVSAAVQRQPQQSQSTTKRPQRS